MCSMITSGICSSSQFKSVTLDVRLPWDDEDEDDEVERREKTEKSDSDDDEYKDDMVSSEYNEE